MHWPLPWTSLGKCLPLESSVLPQVQDSRIQVAIALGLSRTYRIHRRDFIWIPLTSLGVDASTWDPWVLECPWQSNPSGILRIHSNESLEVWSGHIPCFLFVEPHADKRQWAQQNSVSSVHFVSYCGTQRAKSSQKFCLGMRHTWKTILDPSGTYDHIESTWWLYESSFCKASNWGNNSMSRRTPFM